MQSLTVKTLAEAKALHPDVDVWATEEESIDDDGASCEAVYWLAAP